jgi:TPR repeat protein
VRRLKNIIVLVCIPVLLINSAPAAEVFNAVQVRKRAEQGDAEAQFQLGRALASGTGIGKDVSESIQWVRKAAESGLPTAQYSLGFMLENGQLLQRNPAEAVVWYSRAADQGHTSAMSRLEAQDASVKKLLSINSSLATEHKNRVSNFRCVLNVTLTTTTLMTVLESTNYNHLSFANSEVKQVREAFKKFLDWDATARTEKVEPIRDKLIAEFPQTSLSVGNRRIAFNYIGGDSETSTMITFMWFQQHGKRAGFYFRDEAKAMLELLKSYEKQRAVCEENVRNAHAQAELFK